MDLPAPPFLQPRVHSASSPTRRFWCSRLYLVASALVRDPASSTVLQLVSTFGVWLLSERLGFSPIITVVTYAMTLAQAALGHLGARLRITPIRYGETAVFVVNVLAFVLMGLRARMIIERLSPEQRWGSLVFGLSVLARRDRGSHCLDRGVQSDRCHHPALASRLRRPPRFKGSTRRHRPRLERHARPYHAGDCICAPQQFPGRDLIILCTFCVVLGTLVIQGFTLLPLMRLLRFEDDGAVERELSRARVAVMQAAARQPRR